MTLARGFKARAGRIASDLRSEMGLSEHEPFDPFAAAENLGIPLHPFRECINESAHAELLSSGRLSAMTIIRGNFRFFFYDDSRPRTRVVSDISHEIAHALLLHPAHFGCDLKTSRGINPEAELEAAHLGGVLLVSNDAAHHVASSGMDLLTACDSYKVSTEMMTWRLRMSGALKIVERRRKKGLT